MKTIEQAIKDMYANIDAISHHDETMGNVFLQSFSVAANTIEAIYESQQVSDNVDIGGYIEMLNEIFNIDMQQMVDHMLQAKMEQSQKEADQNTLDFIMNDEDLDDYDRFVKENQAKDNLDFLKNEI